MVKEFEKDFEWDGLKGPPKRSYDVIGGYDPAPQSPPRWSKPTGKGDQPTRKGKP